VTRPLLAHPPDESELARLYHELAQHGATSVGERRPWPYAPKSLEQLIALAAEMLRYDPRLLSVLVQWLPRHYRKLNPLVLRDEMRTMRSPQSLLVALEFAKLDNSDREFLWWSDYVSAGFSRVEPAERFFRDIELPGSRAALRNLGRNLAAYARWGFVGRERPIVDPISKRSVGRYDAETRRRILKELAARRDEFSVADYLSAVDHGISRQQALNDLRAQPELEQTGAGRGARWRRASLVATGPTSASRTPDPSKP
jgi:hypothetical protein